MQRFNNNKRSGYWQQRGYVLALTLWILAAVAIAATFFAQRIASAQALLGSQNNRLEALRMMSDARAEVMFRLASSPLQAIGLSSASQPIFLDDRPYLDESKCVIHIQDERGLLNINAASADRIARLLTLYNIPPDQFGSMTATLWDYIDTNTYKRLNGAKAPEYEALGLPPPPGRLLITPRELRQVIGWRERDVLWQGTPIDELLSVNEIHLNPNTAPWQVLATFPGMTIDTAHAVISQRALVPIVSLDRFAAITGLSIDDLILKVLPFPADHFRVTQTVPGLPWALRYSVALTPEAADAPLRVDYSYHLPLNALPAYTLPNDDQSIPPLPPRPGDQLVATPEIPA